MGSGARRCPLDPPTVPPGGRKRLKPVRLNRLGEAILKHPPRPPPFSRDPASRRPSRSRDETERFCEARPCRGPAPPPGAPRRPRGRPASPALQGVLQKEPAGPSPTPPSRAASPPAPAYKDRRPPFAGRFGRHCLGGVPGLTSPSGFFAVVPPVGDL